VGRDGALDVGVAVDGGDPAVVAGAVHPVVEQGAAQQVVEIAAARAIEAGEAGLPSNETWKMDASPKQVPGTPARFIASDRPERSSSPALFARACSAPSATSSSVAMAAAAHTGLELNVPFWATR